MEKIRLNMYQKKLTVNLESKHFTVQLYLMTTKTLFLKIMLTVLNFAS